MVTGGSGWHLSRRFVMVAALAALGAWHAPSRESPGNPRLGRDLFVKKGCMRCHSVWGTGGKLGPSLASVGMGRDLYDVCASVWSHWSNMNAARARGQQSWQPLSAPEVRDIIGYLYYLNYYAEPGDVARGEETFRQKGCVRCHAVRPLEAAGRPGPAVYAMRDLQGAPTLAAALWNHGREMIRTMTQERVPWPRLQDAEVANLIAYLRSESAAPRDSGMTVPGDAERGRALFESRSCADCHQNRAGGAGPDPAVSTGVSSLSKVVASLWNHYPRMIRAIDSGRKDYPKISRGEMEDLISYLYWLKASGLGGNAASGRALYESKQCAGCHSRSDAKKKPVPVLIGSEATRSPYTMLAAIWNHGPKMDALLREQNLSWPKLSGVELRDLVAFFSAGKPEPSRSPR